MVQAGVPLRQGRHFIGEVSGRAVAEHGCVLAFTMFDVFYLHDVPSLGTLLLAWALWRTQASLLRRIPADTAGEQAA
jgi:hypothetical protein